MKSEKENLSDYSDDQLIEILKQLNPNLHNTTDLTTRERVIKAIAVSKSQLEFPSGHFEPDSSGEKSFPILIKISQSLHSFEMTRVEYLIL